MYFDSVTQLIIYLSELFSKHKLSHPQSDAQLIVSHYTGIPRLELNLHAQDKLSKDQISHIIGASQRRTKHEPLQHIFGETCFMGFEFLVDPDVLIPRKETELLVEQVIKDNQESRSLLDIGTGSGNIAISIAKLCPDWDVEATDISKNALKVARNNATRNGVEVVFYHTDLYQGISKCYDIIVSNPPYVSERDYLELSPEVRVFEPRLALLAKEEGLFFFRRILQEGAKHLNPDGLVYFEIGHNQSNRIMDLAAELNYRVVDIYKDYQQFDRIVKLGKLNPILEKVCHLDWRKSYGSKSFVMERSHHGLTLNTKSYMLYHYQ